MARGRGTGKHGKDAILIFERLQATYASVWVQTQTQTLKPELRGKPFIWDLKIMRGVEMSEGREGSRKAG